MEHNSKIAFVLWFYFLGLFSSRSSILGYQNELFDLEKKRQRDAIGRIEKIEVRYLGMPEDTTLVMNKSLSTPYDCAQRKTKHLIPTQTQRFKYNFIQFQSD